MLKAAIPLCAFLLMILIAAYPFINQDPVVPGWHITIYPTSWLITVIIATLLLLGIIGYWVLSRSNDQINRILYFTHFVLTAATVVYLTFPAIFLDMRRTDKELLPALTRRIWLIPYAWGIFITVQPLFFIYYFRTIKKQTKHES